MIIDIPTIGLIRPDIIRMITTIFKPEHPEVVHELTINLIKVEEFGYFSFTIDGDEHPYFVQSHIILPIRMDRARYVSQMPITALRELHELMGREMAKANA